MKILAVDYGDSRTGLAVCDPGEILATPLRPQIEEKAMAKVAAQVCAAAREHGAGLIVIGLPRNMDGTEGARAKKAANWPSWWGRKAACPSGCGTSGRPPSPPPGSSARAAPLAKSARPSWTRSALRSSWKITWPGAKTTPARNKAHW